MPSFAIWIFNTINPDVGTAAPMGYIRTGFPASLQAGVVASRLSANAVLPLHRPSSLGEMRERGRGRGRRRGIDRERERDREMERGRGRGRGREREREREKERERERREREREI